jgi:hypothetical protein
VTQLDEHDGPREVIAALVADGFDRRRIRDTIAREFPGLDPSVRSVGRWLNDTEVRQRVREREDERERSIRRQSRAQLARRLEEGDTGDLTPRELLAIGKDSSPTTDSPGFDLGAWPDAEAAAIAECWRMFTDHPFLLEEYPAVATFIGVLRPGDPDPEESFVEAVA